MLNIVLNWWAAVHQIDVPASACPVSPDGTMQGATAVILPQDWFALFNGAFLCAVLIALAGVFITYQTRTMGDAFARRWRRMLLATALVAGLVCLLLLSVVQVQTFGCQFGEQLTNIPFGNVLNRSTVAFAQALLFFLIWSFLLTRIARITRHQPWYDNSWYPF
jgi:hypothetical protein